MKVQEIPLLKVLIIDDEPFIRKGLEVLIDWESEGCTIAGEASNGKTALELLKKNKYDIIITDIRMPEMDGAEFVSIVKEKNLSQASIIILSGYYDFEYAKTAINCGCRDYILKPIQKDELLTSLRNILAEHKEKKTFRKKQSEKETNYLEKNIAAIIWGKVNCVNIEDIKEKMCLSDKLAYIHFEISLNDKSFFVLPEEGRRGVQKKLCEYAKLLMKKYAHHIIPNVMNHTLCYDMGIIYCQAMAEDKNLSQDEWLKDFLKELTDRVGFEIVACIGNEVKELRYITNSFRDTVMLRSLRFYKKGNDKGMPTENDLLMKEQKSSEFKLILDHLIHAIEINDKFRIKKHSKILYETMMENDMDTELVGSNIQYLIYRLLGVAYNHDTEINQEEMMQYIRETIFLGEEGNGSQQKFLMFIEEYSDYLAQLKKKTVQGSMQQIIEEIEMHYMENLSLKAFGEKYFINSAYLGQVFKKQYGCSFKEHLNNIRIQKAAELILNTDKLIYEIAEEVGYKNREYFVGKFEEMYGVTPTRFRKRWISDMAVR